MIPKILKNFNLYAGGNSLLGKVEEVSLPELKIITEEHRGGGSDSPYDVDMGLSKLELGFKTAEHSPEIYRDFGLIDRNAVQVIFRGAMADDKTTTAYVVTARGMYTSLSGGTATVGKKTPLDAKLTLTYYKLSINGRDEIEIDVDNSVRKIGGVDKNAQMMSILNGQ